MILAKCLSQLTICAILEIIMVKLKKNVDR